MPIEKHSVIVEGRKTSVSLEPLFWNCLKEIAEEKNTSVAHIVKDLATGRCHTNLSSAIRVFVLSSVRNMNRSLSIGRANTELTGATTSQ